MRLNDIFIKRIDRSIEGVIKADDDKDILTEVEEYVLTNEVERNLESFLEAYNNYEGSYGVWISGFFGSGKSHLLKMLAFLLENRSIDGQHILDMFLPKCGDNEMLKGDLRKAVLIPSRSILFNIDQKADITSKKDIDAVLSVFIKVFDEMCGYYGKQGYVARFERDLDTRGEYEGFKNAYKEIAGKNWEKGREQVLLEDENIASAYFKTIGGDKKTAYGILGKYREEYSVSIEDFAEQIKKYIDSKGKDFRLNFFVDEVGQYVAENIKLMTNLQTIAESLSTKCRGRSWIVVTAQQDMESVLGEFGESRGNDFSKIIDRFKTRISLTSRDVEEVIQKRLLSKNDNGVEEISDIYNEHKNNFRTILDFSDGSRNYGNFESKDHFVDCYPFIPYQFPLFQSAIQNLSLHSAFQGKHRSVGERSMLAVFQEVVTGISTNDIGRLASFDRMFSGISKALKANRQQAVITAEKQLNNEFAVRILKALFLVKYVKEFKATLRNIGVLMLENFETDMNSLHIKIKEALDILEKQTYIQCNGEEYEFLTDEEKDIEQEIKNTEIEEYDAISILSEIIFDTIIKDKKIRHSESNRDFNFTRKIDDNLKGREYELCIHVITPLNKNYCNQNIIFQAMGREELRIIFPEDDRFIQDLYMYKRTEKYIKQNISITQQDTKKKILSEKQFQNRKRLGKIELKARELLSKAELVIDGRGLDVSVREPFDRIVEAFSQLVSRAYPNLGMIKDFNYSEDHIERILKQIDENDLICPGQDISEPEREIINLIHGNVSNGKRTTLKELVEYFERKPYGWYLAAILCLLARLSVRGKVEFKLDSNFLKENELKEALLNTHIHANVILEQQIEFTTFQVKQLKNFYNDFFDQPPTANEAKPLGMETAKSLESLVDELSKIMESGNKYPFLELLKKPLEVLEECCGKQYTFYLSDLMDQKDSLIDMKENLFNPIRSFINGSLRGIYDTAWDFKENEKHNFDYLEGNEGNKLISILKDPECFNGDSMRRAKELTGSLKEKVNKRRQDELTEALNKLHSLRDSIKNTGDFKRLSKQDHNNLLQPFQIFEDELKNQPIIAVIRDRIKNFEEQEYLKILSEMNGFIKKGSGKTSEASKIEYVSLRSIKVGFTGKSIATDEDMEEYLNALKKAIKQEIAKGKRIQI